MYRKPNVDKLERHDKLTLSFDKLTCRRQGSTSLCEVVERQVSSWGYKISVLKPYTPNRETESLPQPPLPSRPSPGAASPDLLWPPLARRRRRLRHSPAPACSATSASPLHRLSPARQHQVRFHPHSPLPQRALPFPSRLSPVFPPLISFAGVLISVCNGFFLQHITNSSCQYRFPKW